MSAATSEAGAVVPLPDTAKVDVDYEDLRRLEDDLARAGNVALAGAIRTGIEAFRPGDRVPVSAAFAVAWELPLCP